MDKAGGGGGHTGDHGTLRELTEREPLLQHFRGIGYMGKQKPSKCLIIHNVIPHFQKFLPKVYHM
jgi:hypothetical protein